MRRFMKGCAVTALVLCVLGCVLGMVGSSVAGRTTISEVVDTITEGRIRAGFEGSDGSGGFIGWIRDFLGGEDVDELVGSYATGFYDIEDSSSFVWSQDVIKGDAEYALGSGFTRLDIEVGGCIFETKESEESYAYIKVENAYKFQGYVEEDTLYMISTIGSESWTKKNSCKITLYLPENYRFDQACINLGAGEMTLKNLHVNEAHVEAGAGQITLKEVEAVYLTLDVGAGRVVLKDMEVEDLEVHVGMGEVLADGGIGSYALVECAMGNVQMTLDGRKEDFNCQLESSMGNIDLAGSSYHGLSKSQYINHDAGKELDVECTMGNVSIEFTDD